MNSGCSTNINDAGTYLSADTKKVLDALAGRTPSRDDRPRPNQTTNGDQNISPDQQIPNEPPMAPPARPLAALMPGTASTKDYSQLPSKKSKRPSLVYGGKWSQLREGMSEIDSPHDVDSSPAVGASHIDGRRAHIKRVTYDFVPAEDAGIEAKEMVGGATWMTSESSQLASQVSYFAGQARLPTDALATPPNRDDSLLLFRKMTGSLSEHQKEAMARPFHRYQIPAGVKRRLHEEFERRQTTFFVEQQYE